MQRHTLFALLLTTIVAGCASGPIAPVAPPPAPAPPPVAAAPPPAPVYRGDWRDWPLQPGSWAYSRDARGSVARFGASGAAADVTLQCDKGAGQVILSRRGAAPGNPPMIIRTTTIVRTVSAQPDAATPSYLSATIAPSDTLLDAIGYSRGRFVIEQGMLPTLVIPAWSEVLRVAEDCRR